jgi:hypothetical protein
MTPPENVLSPRIEGTAWIVELRAKLITDWPGHTQLNCNEVQNLVQELGLAGRKSK